MQNVYATTNRNVWHSVVSWLLLIPILYFASMGILWYESAARNNSLSASYGGLMVSPVTTESRAIITLVSTIVLVLALSRFRSVIRLSFQNGSFLLLSLLAMASCAWSQYPQTSLTSSIYLALNTLFALYLSSRFTSKQLLELLLAIGWLCLISSIVLAVFVPKYGLSNLDEPGWRGIYDHKNICSMITIVFMSVAFYLPAPSVLAKAYRSLYVVVSLFVVIMTQSATGKVTLLCLFAYILSMQLIERFSARSKAIALVVGASSGMLLGAIAVSYFNEITYLLGKDPTLTGRKQIWQAAMVSILKHPILGYGYRAFWKGLQGESANVILTAGFVMPHAHNGFLELWLSLGAAGLGLFLYAGAKASRDALLCLSVGKSPYTSWYVCILLLVCVMSIDEVGGIAVPNSLL